MRAYRFLAVGLFCGMALFATAGCGNSNQQTGTMVTETKEVEDSRAAMQRALKENPNMYAPTKSGAAPRSR